jgi:thiamine-phosphate pyrophosphorylase
MGLERGLAETVRLALRAGVPTVQLRDKEASTRKLLDDASTLLALCRERGATFLVNDRVDVAMVVGADGVHLGQDDMPADAARRLLGDDAVIGVSVRTAGEARRAAEDGADYMAANLVYPTSTKTDLPAPLGPEGIRKLRSACGLPLVAIGGIDAGNAAEVIGAGADGLAVVSAIMAAGDPAAASARLLDAARKALARRDS